MTDGAVFAALLLFSDMREAKMRKNIRNIFLVALLLITGAVSCAFAESSGEIDYSDPFSWAYFAEGDDRPADLFLICPTVDMGSEGNLNMDM